MAHDTRTSLRLPADLRKRAKLVRNAMNKSGKGFTYSESDILRAALVRGLDALEQEAATHRKG
jgi:hypothetical protein